MISPITAAPNETGHTAAASQDPAPGSANTLCNTHTHMYIHHDVDINNKNVVPHEEVNKKI